MGHELGGENVRLVTGVNEHSGWYE
jgi:hypothetical protein